MNQQKNMSFFSHLDELRVVVVRCIYIFFGGFMLSFFLLNEYVFDWLSAPLFNVMPDAKLHFIHLFENFMTHLKIAAVTSLFLFSPLYFYQLWSFIAPGLYPKERKYVIPFILLATLFFCGGAAFAYYVLFPAAFHFFLVEFPSDQDTAMLTIGMYYSTCLKLLVLFGAAFELPVLVILFGFLGVIDANFLRKNRQGAIIGIAVICAMFAPPDALSMIIMMIPLIILYEFAILIVHWFGVKRAKQRELMKKEEG